MPKKKTSSSVIVEELEPRILFSAGGMEAGSHISLADDSLQRFLPSEELVQIGIAAPEPVKQEANKQNLIARSNISALDSTYYLDDISGTSDKPVGNLKTTVPTDTNLEDYDTDGEDGLRIDKGGSGANETDSDRFQTWLVDASGETLQGAVSLNLWSAIKDFVTDKGAQVDVFLIDSDLSGGDVTVLASDSISRSDWDLTDSGTWIEDSFDFGNVNHTFGAGRHLGIKLVVDGSSEDDMYFAYDTDTFAARLTIAAAINTVVVDTAVDEDNGDTSSIAALIASPGGAGISFREAIQAANSTANGASPDRIHFDIAGTPPLVISGVLPAISEAVVIDGTTDSDYATNSTPVIEFDGQGVINPGLRITGDGVTIRGIAVNNFVSHGIEIQGDNNRIESSYIGLRTDGSSAYGNIGLGIRINNGANNQIGAPGVGNVISGNTLSGIAVVGSGSNSNIIESNRIGTNANGTAAVSNGDYGIDLWDSGANNNRIGGASLAQRNVISGNDWAGIHISGGGGNIIIGNYIGGNASGGAGASNDGGIDIDGNSSNNQIGGINTGEANIIAFNTGAGVKVSGASSDNNSIQRNEIYDNSGQGIEHLANGNENRASAQLDNAEHDAAGSLLVQGSYFEAALANQTVSIEYFSNPSSDREGRTYLGTETIALDGTGNANIEHILSASVSTGEFVSATVTDGVGNTSEFSLASVVSLNEAPVFVSNGPFTIDEGANLSTLVGDIDANDGDGGAIDADISYSIITNVDPDADSNFAFAIDSDSGEIVVADADDLDFEQSSSLTITVQVHDGFRSSSSDVTINIADVKPTLTASGTGATSAGQSYQLDLIASEPGNNSISTYTVNWGDGTVTTEAYVGTTTTVSHVYNNHGFTNDVSFTANEASGGVTTSDLVTSNYLPGTDDVFVFDGNTGDPAGSFNSTMSQLDRPYGVTVGPDGNFYFTGYESENIVRFAPDGTYLGVFTADSRLNNPDGLTWGGDGNLYVANYGGNNILRFRPDGMFLDIFSAGGNLSGPEDLAFGPDGDLYASSWNNNRIVKIDGNSGGPSTVVLDSSDGLNNPEQIVFGENGDLFIANGDKDEVLRWDGSNVTVYFTHPDLDLASGIAFGPDGALYVTSHTNDKILRFDGASGEVFSDDGPGGLDAPTYIAFKPAHLVTVGPNDPPIANNLNASENYIEETTLNLSNIIISDSDNSTTTATLTLSDLAAGELTTATSGSVSSVFNAATGEWSASGAIADVNTLLAAVSYIPTLNYDSNFSIATSVSDGIAAPITGTKNFTATPINDAPQLINNSLSLSEGDTITLDSSDLSATDVDNNNGDLVFSFSSVSNGFFELSSAPGVAITSASQLQVSTSQLRFVHDGGESSPSYQVSVSDGAISTSPTSALIAFSNSNDAPEITSNSLSISEGQTVIVTSTDLAANDPDHINDGLLLTFSNVSGGHFARASDPEVAITSLLQSQIGASELIFVHDGGEAAPHYEVTASDPASASSASSVAAISFSNVNDAPRIDNLHGNSTVANNNGTEILLDTDVPASVFDSDLPTDIDGAMLSVQGVSLDSLDTVSIAPDSNVTLSNGMNNGSQVSVAGIVVANLSSVSDSGFLLNFVSPATTADADAIMARLAFSTTAATLGNRDIEVQYSDGIDTSDIAQVSLLVTSPASGVVLGAEDQTYTFTQADFDFTGVTGNNLESIQIHSLPSDGVLNLSGVAVSVGQALTQADIISGALQFTPAPDANGNIYADFEFQVNNGIASTNVLAGQTGSPETIEILQESNNFGLGGVYPTGVNIVSPNGSIDSDYLDQGRILFDSSFNNIGWSNAQLSLLDTWVRGGGVLIASSDNPSLDDIADFYGLVIGGNSASTWNVALSSDPIFNGRFGPVGPNGTSLATGGASASYFLSSSLAAGDRVLARDSASNEPTIILRQLGNGWILFTGDENVFDSAMTGGGVISTTNDRFSANVFDWAIDQLPAEDVHTLSISISAVNDPPSASNTNAAESYTEDTSLDLIDIVISDIDSSTVNAKLVLSAPAAGTLSTASTGSATSTYNAGTGVWLASGDTSDVNTLLEHLIFTPSENFEQDFSLDVDINDGAGAQISDSKLFTANPVNDAPVANAGGPYSIVEGDGISFDGSGSFDGDAGDSLKGFQWDLLKGGTVLASDVNSTLSWNELAGFGVNDDGSYQVRLTVSDESGDQDSDLVSLDVTNLDPVFTIAGPATAYQDDSYELSFGVDDPGNDPVNRWVIDWGDGTVDTIAGSESIANHVYTEGGVAPVIYVVADTEEGQYAAANLAISVIPNAIPQGEVLIDNTSPIEEDILTASNSLIDDDGLSGNISYQWLRDGVAISGATESSYLVTADDIGSEISVIASFVDDRNTPESLSSAATERVQPKNRAASLALETQSIDIEENNNSSERIRLSEIFINDDGLGENTLSLTGDDADKFEIVDGILYLKAGVTLDYEQSTQLEVEITVDDPEVDGSPDDSALFTLKVGDIAQEFFVPIEKVEPSAVPEGNEESTEPEAVAEEHVGALEFAEEDAAEPGRGDLPGGTRSAFLEQAPDVSTVLSVVNADQIAKGLFLEQAGISANETVVNLAQIIDLDNVEVRFAALNLLGELPGIDPMEDFSLLDNSSFTNGLDELRRGVESIDLSDKIMVGSSATVTTGLSIGYVLWMVRGSVLLTTILSSLPAWRLIDPLPVISGMLNEEEEDQESLESIIEDGSETEPDPDPDDDKTDIPHPSS